MVWRLVLILASAAPLCTSAVADTRNFLVPGITLYPGDAVAVQGLSEKSFNGSAKVLNGYVETAAQVEGKFARRTLVAGKPIALTALRSAEVVFQGQPAAAAYVSGGLSIETMLVPLESGAAGDSIKARNPESGIIIVAIAQDDGTLLVSAP